MLGTLLGWPGAAAEVEAEKPAVLRGPIPDWVEPSAWAMPPGAPPTGVPAEMLLNDAQDRLTGEMSAYYFHTVVRMLNSEGVRQNAELSVTYEPDHQNVTWHTLRIVRDGQVIDQLATAKFNRLQRERGFEAKIYDGQISAVAVLEDIRVGDVLESAYTLHDTDPLMRGQISGRHYLGSAYPIRLQRVRIRVPVDLPAPAKYFWVPPDTKGLPEALFRLAQMRSALREELVGNERLYWWEATNLPAIQFDPSLPAQVSPYYPTLRLSSFTSWSRVVDWATPLFDSSGTLPDEMRARVAEWKKTLPAPELRLRAAVDFAQNDIRYFAMALGEHGFRPRALSEICSSRFGDCKDKSVLLVALLREFGFEAWPVLVNSYTQARLAAGGPDHRAFNHAIVAYKLNGLLRWVDPTIKQPAGASGDWEVPPYQLGLILRPNEEALSPIPLTNRTEPDTETRDFLKFDPVTGDAELSTEVTVRGLQADYYRQYLESAPAEETSKRWFNYIGRFYRKLEETEVPVIQDDRANNRLSIRARYRLPEFLKTEAGGTGFGVYAYGIRSILDQPESRRRHWPYGLPLGRSIRHRIEVELPFAVSVEQHPQVIVQNGVEYRSEKSLTGKKFMSEHTVNFTRDLVPAAEMGAFCEAVDEILTDLNSGVSKPPGAPEPPANLKASESKPL